MRIQAWTVVKRVLGAVLIALPIVVFLVGMVINKGWGYVVAMLAVTALSVGCVLAGTHLLTLKKKGS